MRNDEGISRADSDTVETDTTTGEPEDGPE